MPSKVCEAFILRSYPFREGDLIISYFTRDQGRLRGVARRARKPKSPFGSGLERLSHVNMHFWQRENVELCRLDSSDLLESSFNLSQSYPVSVALDYFAELCEQLLPPAEPNERFFRLLLATLAYLRSQPTREQATPPGLWPAVLYFSLWAVRLSGFLPNLQLTPESSEIAQEMLKTPLQELAPREWHKGTARDLRRALVALVEGHIEGRLRTAQLLETL